MQNTQQNSNENCSYTYEPSTDVSSAAKKVATLATLKQDIIELIQPIQRLSELKKNPLSYDIKTNEFEKNISLLFKNKDHYTNVLAELESGYADYILLLPETANQFGFTIGLKEAAMTVPDRTNRELALTFMKKFKQHVRQLYPRIDVVTPYLLLANNSTVPLVIEFSDAGDAAEAIRMLKWNFSATREKTRITCSISRDERLHFSIKPLTLPDNVKERAKGLVTQNDIKKNIQYDPRIPATFLEEDYSKIYYLEFNRKPDPRHIVELRASMKIWGVITFCMMAETDCVDGVMRLYVVDGQNRAKACEYDGYPIIYTKVRVRTKEELVELMVMVNNTNKRWSNNNYLYTWAYLKRKPYVIMKEKKKGVIPFSALLPIYQWNKNPKDAMIHFRKGDMIFPKLEESEECIQYIVLLKEKVKLNRDYILGFHLFFKHIKEKNVPYDHNLMMKKIALANGNMPFDKKDTVAHIAERFREFYSDN